MALRAIKTFNSHYRKWPQAYRWKYKYNKIVCNNKRDDSLSIIYILYYHSLLPSEEERKLTSKEVEKVSQTPTNKRHGRPTITLQPIVSRGSEKVYTHTLYSH